MAPMTLGDPLPVQTARRQTRQPAAAENPTRHKIVIGDARRLTQVADESTRLILTSPLKSCNLAQNWTTAPEWKD